jgi:hypothetical protein
MRAFASRKSRPSAIPEGMRVCAVGDVHGRDDLLAELARLIESDCRTARGDVLTRFLGDYVDRGLNSTAAVERLAAGRGDLVHLALRLIVGEALEGEVADVLGRERYERGEGTVIPTQLFQQICALIRSVPVRRRSFAGFDNGTSGGSSEVRRNLCARECAAYRGWFALERRNQGRLPRLSRDETVVVASNLRSAPLAQNRVGGKNNKQRRIGEATACAALSEFSARGPWRATWSRRSSGSNIAATIRPASRRSKMAA